MVTSGVKKAERRNNSISINLGVPQDIVERLSATIRNPVERENFLLIHKKIAETRRDIDIILTWLDGRSRVKFDRNQGLIKEVFTGLSMEEYEEKYGPISEYKKKEYREMRKKNVG